MINFFINIYQYKNTFLRICNGDGVLYFTNILKYLSKFENSRLRK